MLTLEEIKKSVRDIEHVDIESDDDKGVRYTHDGCVIEILTKLIAVRGEDEDDMSWEFCRNPTMTDVIKTLENPNWILW